MNAEDIKNMFEGVDDNTREIVARRLRPELSRAIIAVNSKLADAGLSREHLSPQPDLIMNMFRLCAIDSVKVVILGQDPYIKPGEAQGLSFSVPKCVRIPPSLRNIYRCLHYNELINDLPVHGDLSNWAAQGVLLLNCALTTVLKKSNAHAGAWSQYTDGLLRELSLMPQQIIFILLGGYAQEKAKLIDKRRHVLLEWGHPSPLNSANQTDNPKNFKYCNVFSRANDSLISRGLAPINWDPDCDAPEPVLTLAMFTDHAEKSAEKDSVRQVNVASRLDVTAHHTAAGQFGERTNAQLAVRDTGSEDPAPATIDTLWVFTDGGSKGNGRSHCDASWAFYITDGCACAEAYGGVEKKEIPGEVYKSSNNRGELTAIQRSLEFIAHSANKFSFSEIILVSDSEYSINCLDKWVEAWLANPAKHNLSEKKNLDIIVSAHETLVDIRELYPLKFQHVKSHKQEPRDTSGEEWFLWKCNDKVDKLCNVALGRKVGKTTGNSRAKISKK